ncbi:MAG TPA: histidine phosphatase family protein [Candidatus Acidoferrum sp.]|nr:histidine phosphatase family protein [Candidatus Acidoferrum sp.]
MSERIELYFLRHADAGDPDGWTGPDAERPLSPKGRRQAERLGRHLKAIGFAPDAILTSPKVRAAETAGLVADPLDLDVSTDARLGSGFDMTTVEAILDAAGSPRKAVLVGHDPDFSELLAELVGAASVPMKKGAIARVDVELPIEPGEAVLRWLIPPDALPE